MNENTEKIKVEDHKTTIQQLLVLYKPKPIKYREGTIHKSKRTFIFKKKFKAYRIKKKP